MKARLQMEIYLNSLLQHLILHRAYRTHKKNPLSCCLKESVLYNSPAKIHGKPSFVVKNNNNNAYPYK